MTEFFETEWNGVSVRISATLARRGISASDREDVLQETAIRLFRSWNRLDEERPVEPYARAVANNVWRDMLRRAPKEDLVDVPEAVSSADSVEHVAVVRDEFSRVRRALCAMRPDQSRLLYAVAAEELGDAAPTPATDAVRMARMRARRQLRMALEVASGFAAAFWAGVTRLGRGTLSNPAPVTMVSTAAGALAVVLLSPVPAAPAAPDVAAGPNPNVVVTQVASGTGSAAASRLVAPAARTSAVGTAKTVAASKKTKAKAKDPTYWAGTGPTKVGTYSRVDIDGHGVMVKDNGEALPACTFGISGSPAACAP